MNYLSRRELIRLLGASGAAYSLGTLGCAWSVNPPPTVRTPAVDPAGQIVVPESSMAMLKNVGDAAHLSADGWKGTLLVIHAPSGFIATDGECTHLGCPLAYARDKQLIQCPCHGAEFKLDGSVHHPPASAALRLYDTRIDVDTGQLIVDTLDANQSLPAVAQGSIVFTLGSLPGMSVWPAGFAYTPPGLNGPIWILRTAESTVSVVAATCTYGACVIAFQASSSTLLCPCHGCVYTATGAVQAGPATVALPVYSSSYIASIDLLTIRTTG